MILFSSLWVTLPPDMGVDYKTEAFLPSHCDFFVFGCRISFLVGLSLFFVNGYSAISCDAGVSVSGGELVPYSAVLSPASFSFLSRS